MTPEDIIRMAREAGIETHERKGQVRIGSAVITGCDSTESVTRFATLVAAAQRDKVAHWMRSMGYATGQGKTTEDLLDFLGVGIAEGLEAEVLMEREACAKVCDAAAKKMDDEGEGSTGYIGWVTDCAAAIRARGNK